MPVDSLKLVRGSQRPGGRLTVQHVRIADVKQDAQPRPLAIASMVLIHQSFRIPRVADLQWRELLDIDDRARFASFIRQEAA